MSTSTSPLPISPPISPVDPRPNNTEDGPILDCSIGRELTGIKFNVPPPAADNPVAVGRENELKLGGNGFAEIPAASDGIASYLLNLTPSLNNSLAQN